MGGRQQEEKITIHKYEYIQIQIQIHIQIPEATLSVRNKESMARYGNNRKRL